MRANGRLHNSAPLSRSLNNFTKKFIAQRTQQRCIMTLKFGA